MKKLMVIKSLTIACFAMMLLAVTSCSKPDDRDQFEGSYSIDATGSITVTAYGHSETSSYNFDNEPMTITKVSSSETEVLVSGFMDQTATVQGNTIFFDSFTKTITQDGAAVTLTFDVKQGTLNGNILTFNIDLSGNATYMGYTFPATGILSCVATKK